MSLEKISGIGLDEFKPIPVPEVDSTVSDALTRVAVCLCLDTSGSMEGSRIQKLQEGLNHFKQDLMNDIYAYKAADLAIVSFDDNARIELPFTPMEKVIMPKLKAKGMTNLGEGVLLALEQLEGRKQYYKDHAISYNRPLLFIMSDGCDNGDKSITMKAKRLIAEYESAKKVTAFGINVDDNSAIEELSDLTGKQAFRLDSKNYVSFFEWLSNSVSAKSVSSTDTIALPPPIWIG